MSDLSQQERLDAMYEEMEKEAAASYEQYTGQRRLDELDFPSVKRKRVIRNIALGATLFVAAGAVSAYAVYANSDQVKLGKAYKQLAADYAETVEDMPTAEELSSIYTSLLYGSTTIVTSFNVSGIENLPVTIGVDGAVYRSYPDEKMAYNGKLSILNADVSDFNLYVDGDSVYVRVPLLSEKYLMADVSNFSEEFNNSQLAGLSGLKVPDGIGIHMWEYDTDLALNVLSSTDVQEYCKDEITALMSSIELEHDKALRDIELDDGTVTSCRVYSIKCPQVESEQLLSALLEIYSANNDRLATMLADSEVHIDSDLTVLTLVDESGVIRGIDTSLPLEVNSASGTVEHPIDINIELCGKENPFDQLTIAVKENDSGVSVRRVRDDNEYNRVNVHVDQDNIDVSYVGYMRYTDTIGSLDIDMDELDIYTDGKKLVHMSGNMCIDTQGITVQPAPEENVVDIFHMDLAEMIALVSEISTKYSAIQNFLNKLMP